MSVAHLVDQGLTFETALGEETLDLVAELALSLTQAKTRRAGAILTTVQARPYRVRSEDERAGMRSMVEDVVTALVLLGIIDKPE